MKQIELHQPELKWIRTQLSDHFQIETNQSLKPNSNLKNYELLSHLISKRTSDKNLDEYASQNLLRKLFYDSKQSSSVIFRIGFTDACYRYISKGAFNRAAFIAELRSNPDLDPSHSHPAFVGQNGYSQDTPRTMREFLFSRSRRFISYGLAFVGVIILVLLSSKLIDLRTIPWVVSKPPHHTLWTSEYKDGTKTYNRFRKYRTFEEVYSYFTSESRTNGDWGDCNSYTLDASDKHIPVCYDKKETIEAFEQEHGTPIKVYKDPDSEELHNKN